MDDIHDERKNLRDLLQSGTEIAGGAIAGAISLLEMDPVSAGASGAAAARLLRQAGDEISQRFLGPREKKRVGAVLAIAAQDISRRIANGQTIRSDGFLGGQGEEHTEAAEVAESVILRSQKEPEEKKLHYMGRFLSEVSFNSEVVGSGWTVRGQS